MPTTTARREWTVNDYDRRFAELRGELADLQGGDLETKAPTLLREVERLDAEYACLLHEVRDPRFFGRPGPLASTAIVGGDTDTRSTGEIVFADPAFADWVAHGCQNASPAVEIARGVRAPVFEYGTGGPGNAATTGVNALLPVGQPIAPTPRRARLFLRDLIPVQPTGLSTIPYVRELNPTTNETGASTVSEGGTKPEVSLAFTGVQAPVTVIAGNITVSKQIFEDAATVMGYINGRLPYLVAYREDAELLNGNGLWPDLQGILNTPGLQTQGATSGDHAISIANGIAKVEGADGAATAVVLNPTDAWAMFTKRAAGGSGTFDAGTPFADIPLTVWGLPTYRSRAYAAGTALVGDFEQGAIIFDREQTNIQVYPQHSDYPIKNQVLLQAEERIALAVPRPDLFCKVTLA